MKELLRRIFRDSAKRANDIPDVERARRLIAAIDMGGIPLDPTIVTKIAESFGLEVSRTARTAGTIERIRAARLRGADRFLST